MSFQPLTTRSEALYSIRKTDGTTVDSTHVTILGVAEKKPEEALINKKLPTEIFYKILSFLGEEDLKSAALVTHFWKSISSHIRKNRQFILIKNLGKALIQNIDESMFLTVYQRERLKKRIFHATHDEEIFKTSNLLTARSIIISQREIILKGIKKLGSERRDSLKASFHEFPTPNLFEGILELPKSISKYGSSHLNALIELGFINKALNLFEKTPYREVIWSQPVKVSEYPTTHPWWLMSLVNLLSSRPLVQEIPESLIKNPVHRPYLSRFLKRARAIDALEVAFKLFESEKRNQQLSSICQIFLGEGDINRALKTAEAIDPNYYERDKLLAAICKGFIHEGNLNKALEIIESIDTNYDGRAGLLRFICRSLIREGELYEALKVVRMIPDKELQDMFFSDISELSNQNGGNKDLEIAYEIAYYKPRSLALQDISKALIEKNDMFEIEELSELIPDEFERNLTLQDISETFAKTNNLKKALKAICLISNENRKTSTLQNICEILTLENDIEKTLEVVQLISNDEVKGLTILNICKTLLKNNRIDACLKTALKIINEKQKDRVLSEVCKRFILEKSFDRVLEAVHLISNQDLKVAAIQNISRELVQRNDPIKALEAFYSTYEYKPYEFESPYEFEIFPFTDQRRLTVRKFVMSPDMRSYFLRYVCEQQIERELGGKIPEIASKIPDPSGKKNFLNHACEILIKKNDLENALKVIRLIPDKGSNQRCRLYEEILKIYLNENESKALEIIQELDHDQEKAIILERLSISFTRQKNFTKASQMASMIDPGDNRNSAIWDLCNAYIANNQLDEASEMVHLMSDNDSTNDTRGAKANILEKLHKWLHLRQLMAEASYRRLLDEDYDEDYSDN